VALVGLKAVVLERSVEILDRVEILTVLEKGKASEVED